MMTLAHAVLLAVVVSVGGVWGEGAGPRTVTAPPHPSAESESDELISPPLERTTGHFERNNASSELPNNSTEEISTRPDEELTTHPVRKASFNPRCPAECSCTELQTGTIYTCSLPSGEVEIEETGNKIHFECTNGTLRSLEVPLRGESAGSLAVNGTVSVFVSGCALAAEPLLAVLRRRGPSDASVLTLKTPRTPLTALHVQGLSLKTLRITDLDGAEVEVPVAAMEALASLRSLTLNDGRLVLRGPLPALPLRALELANARLRTLPPAAFRRLTQLRSLSLWRNQLDHIQNDTLQGLELLEQLSLSSNQLSVLPEGLLAPTRGLRQIDLYDNRFAFLPRSLLAGLDRLEEVRLNDNHENLTLDAGVFANLTSLKSLDLSRSKLTALPIDSFSGCGALMKLLLTGNSLHSLPAGLLADLAALEDLSLSENGLAALPAEFFTAQGNLTKLNLDNNNLETLPSSVFRGLRNLRELSLRHNKLRSIENGAFVTVGKLQKLYLSDNQLSLGDEAPSEAAGAEGRYRPWLSAADSPFNGLMTLTRLDLSRNRVRDILDDWRTVLVALKKLDLSWNNISYIDYVSIEFLSPNVEVDLSHNNISTVYLGGESHGSAVITIDDNPFMCDCLTPALQAALREGGGGVGGEERPRLRASQAECATPPALTGTPLRRAQREELRCEVSAPRCPASCRCHRTVDLVALDCDSWPPTGRLPLPADFHLTTTHLRLRHVNSSLRSLPSHVKKLDLSGLNLKQVPELPPAIEVDLSDNHLPVVPIVVFKNNNITVRLARNPLDCNCSHEEDVAALLAIGPSTVLDYDNLTCFDSTSVHSKLGINLCAERDLIINASIAIVVVILLVTVIILCRRYRYKCLMCVDKLCCCPPQNDEEEDRDKDLFLSYAHPDVEWAIKLLDFLEGPPHCLKVCHHERDWVIGEFIPKQIERSVRRSRWTVILLSRHFLASVWGLLEFRVSYLRAHKERKGRILVVLLDDVMSDPQMTPDLRSYVANNTYLHVDDPLFLDKLAYALRPRRVPWWRAAPFSAPAPSSLTSAPLDKQLHSALEAKVAADGALANPAFIGPSVVEIFTHPQKQHNLDTRKPQVA